MNPLVTVIIPNYNNAQFLIECIDSVFSQTYQPLECIVVDDGSTDNSLAILNDLVQKYSNLRIFEQVNSGPSVARNLGMKQAKGEYITFLDADDLWLPNKIENQVNFLKHNNQKIVVTNFFHFDETREIANNQTIPSDLSVYDFFKSHCYLGSPSCFMLHKEVIQNTGLFDSDLRGGEDTDYWLRTFIAGYNVGWVNNVDVKIRMHPDGATGNFTRVFTYRIMKIDKWVKMLHENNYNLQNNDYSVALKAYLSTMSFFAEKAKRYDLSTVTFFIGIKYIGAKYVTFLTVKRFLKAVFFNFKRRAN